MSGRKPPASQILRTGAKVGKYNVQKQLGRGAMGVVYLAHDRILRRDVALKVMDARRIQEPESRARFESEARAMAQISHPNVVEVFDLATHADGSPYIAMELLKGQDLLKKMSSGKPFPLERKLAVIVQVLGGLARAHEAGVIHRDIKPANIFIERDGTVKILDFGVARLTTVSITGTGNIIGTADYMSPEQATGAKIDSRSDLFSVGSMLFELLTGERPFHSDNLMTILYRITHEDPNFERVADRPEQKRLVPILRRALAKGLEERYQTAAQFASDLSEHSPTTDSVPAKAVPAKVESSSPQVTPMLPVRRSLSDEAPSINHRFSVAGHSGFIVVAKFPDGTPGQVFLTLDKEGSAISGLCDAMCGLLSTALQYGVPLDVLVEEFSHTRFEPSGFTKNPELPYAKSILDYLMRWLAGKFSNTDSNATKPY